MAKSALEPARKLRGVLFSRKRPGGEAGGGSPAPRDGDAPASPPCPRPECLAAGPLGVSGHAPGVLEVTQAVEPVD